MNKNKPLLTKVEFRCTYEEKNRLRALAELWSGGSVSEWLRQAIETAERGPIRSRYRKKKGRLD